MYVIRYSIVIVSGLLAVVIIVTQWLAIIRYIINRKGHFSLIPLFGGIFLCISFAAIPGNSYWWLCSPGFLIWPYGENVSASPKCVDFEKEEAKFRCVKEYFEYKGLFGDNAGDNVLRPVWEF